MSSSDPSSQCVGFPWVPTCIASCPLKHTSMLLDTDGYTYDSITDFDRISYKQSAHECRAECAAGVEAALADAARLGFGDPVAISAETGKHRCTRCFLTCQLCQQQVCAVLLVSGYKYTVQVRPARECLSMHAPCLLWWIFACCCPEAAHASSSEHQQR